MGAWHQWLVGVLCLMAMNAWSAVSLPSPLTTSYAVDEEQGWDFLILSMPLTQSTVLGVDLVLYADAEKVALSRLGFVPSLAEPSRQVSKVLLNPRWSAGQYKLVVTYRDGPLAVAHAQTFDVSELLRSLKMP